MERIGILRRISLPLTGIGPAPTQNSELAAPIDGQCGQCLNVLCNFESDVFKSSESLSLHLVDF